MTCAKCGEKVTRTRTGHLVSSEMVRTRAQLFFHLPPGWSACRQVVSNMLHGNVRSLCVDISVRVEARTLVIHSRHG